MVYEDFTHNFSSLPLTITTSQYTGASPYLQRISSKTHSGCLKLWIILNSIYVYKVCLEEVQPL